MLDRLFLLGLVQFSLEDFPFHLSDVAILDSPDGRAHNRHALRDQRLLSLVQPKRNVEVQVEEFDDTLVPLHKAVLGVDERLVWSQEERVRLVSEVYELAQYALMQKCCVSSQPVDIEPPFDVKWSAQGGLLMKLC